MGASAFLRLLGMLVAKAATSRSVQVAGIGAAIVDFTNLDWFRQTSLELAPGSDREALDEVARMAYRLLHPTGGILWPRDSYTGQPIPPMYLVLDFNKGRGWFTRKLPTSRRRRGGYYAGLRRFPKYPRGLIQRRARYA
jgi:hypothetical protein